MTDRRLACDPGLDDRSASALMAAASLRPSLPDLPIRRVRSGPASLTNTDHQEVTVSEHEHDAELLPAPEVYDRADTQDDGTEVPDEPDNDEIFAALVDGAVVEEDRA